MRRNESLPEKLSSKQLALIRLLCEGCSVEQASEKAKISRATAFRWMNEADFKRVLERTKTEIFSQAISELKIASLVSAQGLIALLGSKSENTRRLTAVQILEMNFRMREVEGIEERLSRLEKIIKRNLGPHGVLFQVQENEIEAGKN
jgi:hypothetical protein